MSDPTVADTGEATYEVGSRGNILLIPSVMEDETVPGYITVEESDFIYKMDIEVQNKLSPLVAEEQYITIDKVDVGDWTKYIKIRIDSNDLAFSLESDSSRIITVEIEATEAALINLPSDTVTVNYTIYAMSETVADAPTTQLTVVLQKQSADDDGDGASSEEDGELVKNIVLWAGSFLLSVFLDS